MIAMLAIQSAEILAQVDVEINPKAPAGSNGILEIVRIVLWIVFIAGILAIIIGGGMLGWEKMNGGVSKSPMVIGGAMAGGVIASSASGIINMVIAASNG